MDSYIEYIGMLAGFCTTIAFVPQLIKVLKTKTAKGISTSMYYWSDFVDYVWCLS